MSEMEDGEQKAYAAARERIEAATKDLKTDLFLSDLALAELPPEIGSLTELRKLYLDNNRLTTLPPEIGSLAKLEELHLDNNQLAKFPPVIGALRALRTIYLNHNQLEALPPEIVSLTALEDLNLSGNRLTSLPPEVASLTALKEIHLHGNKLTTLPPEIASLTALVDLNLHSNEISELPAALFKLQSLQELYLYNNGISSLSPDIGNLKQLRALYLGGNRLTSLPRELGRLAKLETLWLHNNRLSSLPSELRKLTKLERLSLHGNPQLRLPPELLGPEWFTKFGAKAARPADILAFYFRRQLEVAGAAKRPDPAPSPCTLNEAKILVVGEPGVGKTALIHRLIKGRRLANPEWTKGIKIAAWSVSAESKDNAPIRVNVWDFGGQEIMQATHQFFLTERSLYVLLIDSRENEEQSKVRYWLDKIRAFGGDSPVIVVLNKRDEGAFEPDEARLRKDYKSNLRDGFFRIVCNCNSKVHRNCRCGEGVAELRDVIVHRVRELENVRQEVPPSYLKAKTLVEAEAGTRKSLSRREYADLCKKYKLNRADGDALLSYLKQLGTLFHYETPDEQGPLPETYVLDPTWVTNGVYLILADVELRERHGELLPADVARIFRGKRDYRVEHQQFILAMMEAEPFDLCFRVPGPPVDQAGLRLIPELLSPNEPDHNIAPATSLSLEYHYPYLPVGLLPRFIVRMHNAVSQHTYWKNGVVLKIDGRRVLVRGSREEKKVFVSVEGREPGSRRALVVVRENLASVHASMRHLEPTEMVALPDDPGVTVGYKDLEKYEKDEGLDYNWRPQGAARKYTVRELLEGIQGSKFPEDTIVAESDTPLLAPKGRVFISYAWEDENFTRRVRKLADDLRESGVDAWIDQYEGELGPAEGWPSWMEKTIRNASVVLMVCSPKYLRRVNKEEEPGKGLGATWEAHLINQHLYESGTVSDKFRAVLLDEAHRDSIPKPVSPFTHFKLYEKDGFELLYRALTGQQGVVAPPLGTPRKLSPK